MEFNKQVSNPMLIGAIELMKADRSQEHHNMLVNEILKAQFLTPATVDPVPVENEQESVKPGEGTKIQFPMLTAPDGKSFFVAFTDQMELDKWKREDNLQKVAMNFDDYVGLLFRQDARGMENPSAGFVINPFGCNIVMTKEMVKAIWEAREQARKDVAARRDVAARKDVAAKKR